MTNVRVCVMDITASEVYTHASKIEERINGHDLSDVLIDDSSVVNAIFERLLMKLGI